MSKSIWWAGAISLALLVTSFQGLAECKPRFAKSRQYLSVELPAGFQAPDDATRVRMQLPRNGGNHYAFVKPHGGEDGSMAAIQISLRDIGPLAEACLGEAIETDARKELAALEQGLRRGLKDVTASEPAEVVLGGVPFLRLEWSGHSGQHAAKGVIHTAVVKDTVVTIQVSDLMPGADKTVPEAEASLKSLVLKL